MVQSGFWTGSKTLGNLDSELFSTGLADFVRGPFGLPDQLYFCFADLRDAGETVVDLLEDEAAGGALRGGEGHGDLDPLARPGFGGVGVGAGGDGVNQA